MGDTILLRRGTVANLPDLQAGEPGWAEDSNQLYIGTTTGTSESAMPIGGYDWCPESFTQASIESVLTSIGTTNNRTLLLRPGTWVISSDADWSSYSNVTFKIMPGAVFSGAFTITLPGDPEAGRYQIFASSIVAVVGLKYPMPEWFGATADNTQASGSTNIAAINKAIAGGNTKPNWDVGTYYISSYIVLKAGTTLEATPSTIIKAIDDYEDSAATHRMIKGDGVSNLVIRGFTLDGNKAGYSTWPGADRDGDIIYIAGTVTNVLIENNIIKNATTGAAIVAAEITGLTIQNNRFETIGDAAKASSCDAIYAGQSSKSKILNNVIIDYTDTGVAFDGTASDILIQGNTITPSTAYNATNGIAYASTGSVTDAKILDNYIEGPTGKGVYIYPTGGTHKRITIEGNTIADTGDSPIIISTTMSLDGLEIVNNYIHKLAATDNVPGIYITGASIENVKIIGNTINKFEKSGIDITVPAQTEISNNTLINCGDAGAADGTGAGIRISSATINDYTIVGNSIKSTTGNMYYGIAFDGTVSSSARNLISGNNITGYSTANAIDITGTLVADIVGNSFGATSGKLVDGTVTGTVKDNSGMVTENQGTATLLNTATYIDVTHGCWKAPTFISITWKENPTNAIGDWWVDNVGATTFRVNGVDPGASNLDFYWFANTY